MEDERQKWLAEKQQNQKKKEQALVEARLKAQQELDLIKQDKLKRQQMRPQTGQPQLNTIQRITRDVQSKIDAIYERVNTPERPGDQDEAPYQMEPVSAAEESKESVLSEAQKLKVARDAERKAMRADMQKRAQ